MRALAVVLTLFPLLSFGTNVTKTGNPFSNAPDLPAAFVAAQSTLTPVEKKLLYKVQNKLAAADETLNAKLKEINDQIDSAVKDAQEEILNEYKETQRPLAEAARRAKAGGENLSDEERDRLLNKLDQLNSLMATAAQTGLNQKMQAKMMAQKTLLDEEEAKVYERVNVTALVLLELERMAKELKWNDDYERFAQGLKIKELKLLSLERHLDSKIAGAYLNAKLDRLVNSDLFCEATRECSTPGKRPHHSVAPLFHNERGLLPHQQTRTEQPVDSDKGHELDPSSKFVPELQNN